MLVTNTFKTVSDLIQKIFVERKTISVVFSSWKLQFECHENIETIEAAVVLVLGVIRIERFSFY